MLERYLNGCEEKVMSIITERGDRLYMVAEHRGDILIDYTNRDGIRAVKTLRSIHEFNETMYDAPLAINKPDWSAVTAFAVSHYKALA